MSEARKYLRSELPVYEGGTPSFTQFDPRFIPWQQNVVRDMDQFDYSKGVHEILLSGAVGSAKSLLMAHQIIKHCLKNPYANFCIGRRSMPDLKDTIFKKIIDHIGTDLKYEAEYRVTDGTARISFFNRSKIISKTWADKRMMKVRSLELTGAAVEELAENNDEDRKTVEELISRIGRTANAKDKWFMAATNPDSPSHWAYARYIKSKNPLRHVYYSVTTDNPFLPREYVDKLLAEMDPKMAQRMLFGRWLDITGETVYHQYDSDLHEPEFGYKVEEGYPIHLSFDFNIGAGKPLSVIFYQIVGGIIHFFDEVVIEGARTESNLEDAANRNMFEFNTQYLVHGDASGRHRDTRSKTSDYDIIEQFLLRYTKKDGSRLQFKMEVPLSNPPVRTRHNTVNAYLKNAVGDVRILVYPKAKTLREGFKLTKLRKGAGYVEDDSKFYQHISTAAGYGICWHHLNSTRKLSSMREL